MVTPEISDLFFNTDHDDAKDHDHKGVFIGYDKVKMASEADNFLNCLSRLGAAVPTREELLADFYSRL